MTIEQILQEIYGEFLVGIEKKSEKEYAVKVDTKDKITENKTWLVSDDYLFSYFGNYYAGWEINLILFKVKQLEGKTGKIKISFP